MVIVLIFLLGMGGVYLYDQGGGLSYIAAFVGSVSVFWSLSFSIKGLLRSTLEGKINLDGAMEDATTESHFKKNNAFAQEKNISQENLANHQNFQEHQEKENLAANQEQNNPQIPLTQKLYLGLGLSFSLLRILAYVLFALLLIVLLELKMFKIYAYMGGIFSALIGVIFQILLRGRDFASKVIVESRS